MLKVVNLVKTYKTKRAESVRALNDVTIEFPETGLVFLLGKSGSGKSTLLNAIGGLDVFDSGEIIIKGKSSKDFSQSDFDSYRNTFIGFIFQEYNILENFTVAKNLELALELQGKRPKKEEVNALLEQVDMLPYANRKPNRLSGGQKQRVAIARALIKNPEIIMADEPTGALDSNTGKQVMETLKKLSKEKLVIIVSHDREFAKIYGDRIIELKDGKIISDVTKKEIIAQETESGIKRVSEDLFYIRKGQNITTDDAIKLAKVIMKKSSERDMFLSFDDEANQKLKEGAKINDAGNKEAFLQTTSADVVSRSYNGKELKLIKSHLKFSDSFKMGASSLKTKVGKLIFTILLSFFAFTVFGLVDTFSTWNRATSVWQGLEYDKAQYVIMHKEKNINGYNEQRGVSKDDLTTLKTKYPDIDFVAVGGLSKYNLDYQNIEVFNHTLTKTANPAWMVSNMGCVNMTESEIAKAGLSLTGRLPENDSEVAITNHLWECIKHGNSAITSWNSLKISIDYLPGYLTVVGVVDDKSNYSEYQAITEDEFSGESGYSKKNTIINELSSGFSNLIFLSSDNVENVNESFGYQDYNYTFINNESIYYTISVLSPEKIDNCYDDDATASEVVEQCIYYYKGGKNTLIKSGMESQPFTKDSLISLGKNEVLVAKDYVDGIIADPVTEIIAGTLKLKIAEDYYGKKVIKEYNVVGLTNNIYTSSFSGGFIFATGDEYEELEAVYGTKYSGFMAILSGTNADEKFITECETLDSNNIKYTVQNSATNIFDTFESIISIVSSVFFYVAIAFAVFAGLLLMNFISTSVNNKKREIGVLRALGARGSDIYGIFFNESSIIAFINFILAGVASFVASMVINKVIIKKIGASVVLLNFGLRQILLILAVSWGSAILASLIPSIKISKKRPIDAINNR